MPHEFASGAFYRAPAWHGLGNVFEVPITSWSEARRLGGLEWEVVSLPVYSRPYEEFPSVFHEVPGWQRLARSDNGETLSVQPSTYAVIGNAELGSVIDYLLGGEGLEGEREELAALMGGAVILDALVSLKGGRIIAVTLRTGDLAEVPGDASPHQRYLVITSRHDGQGGLKIGQTWVRVVCANTWAMAERDMDRSGLGYTIRHTSTWAERLAQVKVGLMAAQEGFNTSMAIARHLAARAMKPEEMEGFLNRWMPLSSADSDRVAANVLERRQAFRALFESETNECIEATFWRLAQTAFEWADHGPSNRNEESQVTKQLVTGSPAKVAAVKILQGMY